MIPVAVLTLTLGPFLANNYRLYLNRNDPSRFFSTWGTHSYCWVPALVFWLWLARDLHGEWVIKLICLLTYLLTYLLTRRARVCDLKASATLSVMEMTVYIHPIQQSCKLAVEADPCVCLRGIWLSFVYVTSAKVLATLTFWFNL